MAIAASLALIPIGLLGLGMKLRSTTDETDEEWESDKFLSSDEESEYEEEETLPPPVTALKQKVAQRAPPAASTGHHHPHVRPHHPPQQQRLPMTAYVPYDDPLNHAIVDHNKARPWDKSITADRPMIPCSQTTCESSVYSSYLYKRNFENDRLAYTGTYTNTMTGETFDTFENDPPPPTGNYQNLANPRRLELMQGGPRSTDLQQKRQEVRNGMQDVAFPEARFVQNDQRHELTNFVNRDMALNMNSFKPHGTYQGDVETWDRAGGATGYVGHVKMRRDLPFMDATQRQSYAPTAELTTGPAKRGIMSGVRQYAEPTRLHATGPFTGAANNTHAVQHGVIPDTEDPTANNGQNSNGRTGHGAGGALAGQPGQGHVPQAHNGQRSNGRTGHGAGGNTMSHAQHPASTNQKRNPLFNGRTGPTQGGNTASQAYPQTEVPTGQDSSGARTGQGAGGNTASQAYPQTEVPMGQDSYHGHVGGGSGNEAQRAHNQQHAPTTRAGPTTGRSGHTYGGNTASQAHPQAEDPTGHDSYHGHVGGGNGLAKRDRNHQYAPTTRADPPEARTGQGGGSLGHGKHAQHPDPRTQDGQDVSGRSGGGTANMHRVHDQTSDGTGTTTEQHRPMHAGSSSHHAPGPTMDQIQEPQHAQRGQQAHRSATGNTQDVAPSRDHVVRLSQREKVEMPLAPPQHLNGVSFAASQGQLQTLEHTRLPQQREMFQHTTHPQRSTTRRLPSVVNNKRGGVEEENNRGPQPSVSCLPPAY